MSASKDFLPRRESQLVTWIGTFNGLVKINFASYGITLPQSTNYDDLAQAFLDAYALANADATRSPANIVAKNSAKVAVVDNTRVLAGIIQKFPGTTDEMRAALGLNIPASRTPITPPNLPPIAEVVQRLGTRVRYRLHDGSSGSKRSRPAGVQGARIYTHIGPTAPALIEDYEFQGQATKTLVDVDYPAETPAGTVVWFTACWYTARGLTSQACPPISAILAGGAMEETA